MCCCVNFSFVGDGRLGSFGVFAAGARMIFFPYGRPTRRTRFTTRRWGRPGLFFCHRCQRSRCLKTITPRCWKSAHRHNNTYLTSHSNHVIQTEEEIHQEIVCNICRNRTAKAERRPKVRAVAFIGSSQCGRTKMFFKKLFSFFALCFSDAQKIFYSSAPATDFVR